MVGLQRRRLLQGGIRGKTGTSSMQVTKREGFVRVLTWVLSESPDSRKMPVVVKVASPASAAITPVDGATYPTAIAVSSPAVQSQHPAPQPPPYNA